MRLARGSAQSLAPWIGCTLWIVVSAGLTIAGGREVPEGGLAIAISLYGLGALPGLLAVRRLAVENQRVLAHGPAQVHVWNIFVPRIWVMMIAMMAVGQILRVFPVHPWIRVAFYLLSASALLCGAAAFMVLGIGALRRRDDTP